MLREIVSRHDVCERRIHPCLVEDCVLLIPLPFKLQRAVVNELFAQGQQKPRRRLAARVGGPVNGAKFAGLKLKMSKGTTELNKARLR